MKNGKNTMNSKIINIYYSLSEASKSVNGDSSSIAKCCKNSNKIGYNYKWKYLA